jgi:biotin carboxylase
MRIVLVIPTATYRAPDFVRAAGDLGVGVVVVSDGDLPLAGERVEQMIVTDLSDHAEAAQVIAGGLVDLDIDAVIGVDDGAVLVAAEAARALGVPHATPDAVAATRDKAVMRELLAAQSVPQPAFAVVDSIESAAGRASVLGYPVVLKPLSLSASRGVIRADDESALRAVWERVRRIAEEAGAPAGQPLLLEEFVSGPEVAVEGLVTDGTLEVLAVFDKPDPLEGPFFEETIYVTPSRLGRDAEIRAIVEAGVRALGLDRGPVHAEVRFGPEGPVLIEVAGRSIGGLCSRALTFGMLGGSLEEQIIRAALGLTRRGMARTERATGVMMLPTPAEGVLEGVRHTEAVAEVEGVTGIEITVTTGRWVRPLPEGDRYLGFLFAEGETPDDVEAALREAHGLLDVRIDPDGVPTGDGRTC